MWWTVALGFLKKNIVPIILLVFIAAVYFAGYAKGKDSMRPMLNDALTAFEKSTESLKQCAGTLNGTIATIDSMNAEIAEMGAESERRLADIKKAAEIASAIKETNWSRTRKALLAENTELKRRMESMSVCDSCMEALRSLGDD